MNVAIVSHLFPSEQHPLRGSFVAEQAEALSRSVGVTVVSGVYGREEAGVGEWSGMKTEYVRLPRLSALPSSLALLLATPVYVFKTWRALRGEAADVLHAHYAFPDGVVGVAVARAKGIPCVVTLHGTDANRQMKRRLVGPLIARAIGRADRIVCVSNRMESELRNAFPRLADRLATVKNGYSPDFIYFQKKPSADYFLFVGNLEPVKNPDILIEAFARIADHTKRDLLVVGDGPMADEIARMADRLGVSGRVRMAGTLLRPDLREAYRSAVALVLPSRSEGMPIVVSESLATGTPVVASDVGGISELVTSDRLGILVPPNDVEALAAGMLAADTREWDEEEIAREAPIVSWADNAERVVALYHQVAVPAKSAGGKHA